MMARPAITALSLLLFGAVCWALIDLPAASTGLTRQALAELARSGVTNPVTAALLNYRGYDTLLEVSVFLLAIIGVWSVREGDLAINHPPIPTLLSLLRLVQPVLILAGGYLLWIGSFAPGGAFQGGAVIGGGAVLVLIAGLAGGILRRPALLRFGLTIGSLVFTSASAVLTFATGFILGYPPGDAAVWILVIESAALISIALTMGALYLGGRPMEAMGKPKVR
jgi:multisubunit Na+/H+ antiporter MnhB subunit